jgi:hypothetical protein
MGRYAKLAFGCGWALGGLLMLGGYLLCCGLMYLVTRVGEFIYRYALSVDEVWATLGMSWSTFKAAKK